MRGFLPRPGDLGFDTARILRLALLIVLIVGCSRSEEEVPTAVPPADTPTAAAASELVPRAPVSMEANLCGTVKAIRRVTTDKSSFTAMDLDGPAVQKLAVTIPPGVTLSQFQIDTARSRFPEDLQTPYGGKYVCGTGIVLLAGGGNNGVLLVAPADLVVAERALVRPTTAQVPTASKSSGTSKFVTSQSQELNLTSKDFGAGWQLESDVPAAQQHRVNAFRAIQNPREALAAGVQVISVVRIASSTESAREVFSAEKQAISRRAGVDDIRIADEAFVFATGDGWQVRFRYLNVIADVTSTGALAGGSRDDAVNWAKKLDSRIRANAKVELR